MADRAILLTYRDYCELPDDGRRYEIHDGELSVTPAPNPRHQRLVGALYRILHAHVRSHGLGEVFLSPLDVILSDIAIVQPDVVYLERSRAGAVSSRGIEGAATLAVEILSPWTAAIDRQRKRQLYARYGCPSTGSWTQTHDRSRRRRSDRRGTRKPDGWQARNVRRCRRSATWCWTRRPSGARLRGKASAGSRCLDRPAWTRAGAASELVGGALDFGPLPVRRADLGLDAPAHVEVPGDLDPAGLGRRHEVVQDPIRHVLVEHALVPIRPDIELERLELDQVRVGHVADADRPEVGLAGPRAEAGELRHGHRDLVVPVRVRVRHDLEHLRRRAVHARIIAARAQWLVTSQARFDELVSPMPTATATLARRRSSVRGSPATRAAAMMPKIGWVRKKAAR